jgi:glutathione S-transferase
MKLYGSSLSPYVRKVMMFAAAKGIDLELQPIALGAADPEFREASPFGKMPGFRDGDFTICDSSAIVTYIEAKYPEPPLFPAEPKERARAVWFDEFADTIFMEAGRKVFFNRIVLPLMRRDGDLAAADHAATEELPRLYTYLEGVVPADGWLVGDKMTIADIAVVSPFVNMLHAGAEPEPAMFPKLTAYVSRWFDHPILKPLIDQEKAFLAKRL